VRHASNQASDRRAIREKHGGMKAELIVGYYKQGSGRASMSWAESVDEALCFGWIDGVRKRIDDDTYQIRFTPRKPTSIWSRINIERALVLKRQGRMREAGLKAFAHRRAHHRDFGIARCLLQCR
jgi:uncharacterized protein YdeI (YjbR/CyaY-like superfamily)